MVTVELSDLRFHPSKRMLSTVQIRQSRKKFTGAFFICVSVFFNFFTVTLRDKRQQHFRKRINIPNNVTTFQKTQGHLRKDNDISDSSKRWDTSGLKIL